MVCTDYDATGRSTALKIKEKYHFSFDLLSQRAYGGIPIAQFVNLLAFLPE
jgi:hypothetical protein